jgi:hypothetical protein
MNRFLIRSAMTIAAITLLLHSGQSFAQSIWMDPDTTKSFSLEVLKPDFKGSDGVSTTTSVLFFGLQVPVKDGLVLQGELPLTHFATDSFDRGEGVSSSRVANPYIGLRMRTKATGLWAEVGARIPVVKADALEDELGYLTGLSSDLVDRAEAFLPDTFPVNAALDYRKQIAPKLTLRLRGGASGLVPTRNEGGAREVELFGLYSAQGWFDDGKLRIGGGLSGRQHLTGSSGEDTNLDQFGLGASYALGRFRPGIELRMPLDKNLRDSVGSVLGLSLQVGF